MEKTAGKALRSWIVYRLIYDYCNYIIGFPAHNKFSESVFGRMDFMLRQKPNISTITSEAFIMFSNNKTSSWFAAKSTEEKSALFKMVRQKSKQVREQFKERQQAINDLRRQDAENAIAKAEAARKKKQQTRTLLTSTIQQLGFWQKPDEVDEALAKMKTAKEKEKAIKAQLKYRQDIICQQGSKELFAFSQV
jgi:L,D-peptidoglycan transpeptidase YkuD (ErfK/YbiS/YcfS/YnhG family)